MLKTRSEVAPQDTWNTAALFPSLEEWNEAFLDAVPSRSSPHWPAIAGFRGRLADGEKTVLDTLNEIFSRLRELTKVLVWAHLKHDEDLSNPDYKAAYARAMQAYHQFNQEISWFQPELLSLPGHKIKEYLSSATLAPYRHYLESIVRLKPHTLTPGEERILALSGASLQAAQRSFAALTDADMQFGQITDDSGKVHALTHGSYAILLRDQNPELRQKAFEQYHEKYGEFQNTLGELLTGQIQKNFFHSSAKNYFSCMEAALSTFNIPSEVYHNLVNTVNRRLPSLHRYLKLRKKILGLNKLRLADLYVPLTKNVDITMPYEEAVETIVASVAPLGTDYQKILEKGLKTEGWVDRYENKSKRSGAYSSGCYDSMPYILMNYKPLLRDVFTLAHEAGHSMHSYLSAKNQPFHYGDYSIFVAEVASTFNEELLMRHLLEKKTGKEERAFLINQKLEDIRATLFRQTMFAEFELLIHQMAERHEPTTPQALTERYRELSQRYFGSDVEVSGPGLIEWARIPHFYFNFYVYQYATGISAALALADKVSGGGEKERNDYLAFLSSGCSDYPIPLLKKAGVDMTTSEPVDRAIDRFDSLMGELENLIG